MRWIYLVAMLVAGAAVGFQAPINAALGRRTGFLEAALVSFSVGVLTMALVVLLFGKGNLGAALRVSPVLWLGGLLGAVLVATMTISVPHIGLTAALVAMIAGEVFVGLAIDHFGWFGVRVVPVNGMRVLGTVLLFVSLWLVFHDPAPGPTPASGPAPQQDSPVSDEKKAGI